MLKIWARLSEMMCEKCDASYSIIARSVRRKITSSLIKSIGLCTRGSRSTFSGNLLEKSIDKDAHTSELTSRVL